MQLMKTFRTTILTAALLAFAALTACKSTKTIAGYDAEIARVESELAEAEAKGMGADHPTVVALNEEMNTLQKERDLKLRWATAPEAERGF